MKLTYWRGEIPNFGDDLNEWLWSRLLPNFFDANDQTLFIGIGSILYHDYPASATKVVFGSGYGGYTQPPSIDQTWKIYFVRGPRTAATLQIDRRLGIGDPASLVGTIPEALCLPKATAGPAFMPHWESTIDGSWERVAQQAGIRYIDPRWTVERILSEIASSTVLITEAMHGAIVADALRVPWIPLAPIGRHRFKWHDWAESLGIVVRFSRSAPSTLLEAALRCFNSAPQMQKRLIFHGRKYQLAFANAIFRPWAVSVLRKATTATPHLSSDAAIRQTWALMDEKLIAIRSDFEKTAYVR